MVVPAVPPRSARPRLEHGVDQADREHDSTDQHRGRGRDEPDHFVPFFPFLRRTAATSIPSSATAIDNNISTPGSEMLCPRNHPTKTESTMTSPNTREMICHHGIESSCSDNHTLSIPIPTVVLTPRTLGMC